MVVERREWKMCRRTEGASGMRSRKDGGLGRMAMSTAGPPFFFFFSHMHIHPSTLLVQEKAEEEDDRDTDEGTKGELAGLAKVIWAHDIKGSLEDGAEEEVEEPEDAPDDRPVVEPQQRHARALPLALDESQVEGHVIRWGVCMRVRE
jgi:hypothetical protein